MFLELNKELYYHRFDIRIVSTESVRFIGWSGAVIRNNLIYASRQIQIKENKTLENIINEVTLNEDHPLYKELNNGFPKGYILAFPELTGQQQDGMHINKGELFIFSLILIGRMVQYRFKFFEAVQRMCEHGLGYPIQSFKLVDISENNPKGPHRLVVAGKETIESELHFPVSLSDYARFQASGNQHRLLIQYLTPVCLYKQHPKIDRRQSYQDKCNGFPSFYQLVRSAAYRLLKLTILYLSPEDSELPEQLNEYIEEYIENASVPVLTQCNIQRITPQNTLKKEAPNRMTLSGYIGEQVYEGLFNHYLPLLGFMEELGVGNEVVYGMGRYEVEVG